MGEASDAKQVATRVSPRTWEILQVAMLLEKAESLQSLLRPVVEEWAEQLATTEPEVARMLEQLDGYQARKRGVTPIRSPQLPQRKSNTGE
jgi:hypothetical protein